MEASRAKLAVGLAAAAAALAAAVVLLHFQVRPVPVWFYVFAWYPTLLFFDLLVVWLGGASLFARPRVLLPMLWWSAVIWLLFEAINFRLQDWYYVFLPASVAARWIGITLSLATVVPAILLPERLLDRLGAWRTLRSAPLAPRRGDLGLALALGAGLLGATLALPRSLYPLTWGAVWLMAEPLLYRADPTVSLFGDMRRGEWGRIARLLAAGLAAGGVWEAFNAHARAKWIYTVPFLEHAKVFEMPLIGFLGFPFFALEVWSLYHLLAPRTRAGPVLASVGFAACARPAEPSRGARPGGGHRGAAGGGARRAARHWDASRRGAHGSRHRNGGGARRSDTRIGVSRDPPRATADAAGGARVDPGRAPRR